MYGFSFALCWQCSIPVFDGLFDGEDDDDILQLLFACAHWHALAKLRMHTDRTLALQDEATTFLGIQFRRFVNHTCRKFNTCELQREAKARARRAAKKSPTSAPSSGQVELATQEGDVTSTSTAAPAAPEHRLSHPAASTLLPGTQRSIAGSLTSTPITFTPLAAASHTEPVSSATRRAKTFNLDTYKYHSLGDYVEHIRQYGTTNSYSTEPVRRSWFCSLVTS